MGTRWTVPGATDRRWRPDDSRVVAATGADRPASFTKRRRTLSRTMKVVSALAAPLIVSGGAMAVTNWTVALASTPSAHRGAASVAALSIAAVAIPVVSHELYPGGTGDVVVSIWNPNPFSVTITDIRLPTDRAYATGYTTSALTTVKRGCLAATPSNVTWNHSTAVSGSTHTLRTPLTVAAKGRPDNPLIVTFTGEVSMARSAPAACEKARFRMPSLSGVRATKSAAKATTSPAIDSWTH